MASPPDTSVPPPPVYVVSTHETTTYNGQTRLYDLSIPVDYDTSRSYPLVLSFHGSPGTADLMLQLDPFDPASKKDAIVAYPNALGSDRDLTLAQTIPDFGFTKALVDLVAAGYNIDKSKVYGVGWSGGGFFVNMLACTRPGMMRAFAAHSGGAPYDDINPGGQHYGNGFVKCSESEAPVAAIIIHGALDPAVPYASGQFDSTYWGFVNGCSDSTTATNPAPVRGARQLPGGHAGDVLRAPQRWPPRLRERLRDVVIVLPRAALAQRGSIRRSTSDGRPTPGLFTEEHLGVTVEDQVMADFAAGDSLNIDGWRLARTELQLCVLATMPEVAA